MTHTAVRPPNRLMEHVYGLPTGANMITIEGNQLLLDGKPVGNIDVPIGTTDHQRLLAWSSGNSPERVEIKDLYQEISGCNDEIGDLENEVEDLESDIRDLEHDLKVLRAELSTAQKEFAWQPIETAPDKKVVILFEPHSMGGFQFFGAKSLDGNWFSILGYEKQLHPTHWRPHNCPHPGNHGPNQ